MYEVEVNEENNFKEYEKINEVLKEENKDENVNDINISEDELEYCEECKYILRSIKKFDDKMEKLFEMYEDVRYNFLIWGFRIIDENCFIAAPKYLAPILGYTPGSLNNIFRRCDKYEIELNLSKEFKKEIGCLELFKKKRCWHLYINK